MNVQLKVLTGYDSVAITLDNFEEIFNFEHPEDYDRSPDAELWVNDRKLLDLSFEEACELAEMPSDKFEMGLEYCRQVFTDFSAWQLAEEQFACHNYDDAIVDMLLSNSSELQEVCPNLLRHFDFEAYWVCDVRHDYTETDNYIFRNN